MDCGCRHGHIDSQELCIGEHIQAKVKKDQNFQFHKAQFLKQKDN